MWNTVVFVFAVIAVSAAQPPPECLTPLLVDPETCCPSAPKFVSKQIIDDCTSNGPINCDTSKCVLKKGNFLTTDGKVDKAALRSYVVPAEWTSIISTGLDNCFSKMNGGSCESLTFVGCMAFYLINNCPANQWKNNADCTAFKTFMNKCHPL